MKELFRSVNVPQETFENRVDTILTEVMEILKKKNKMYGGASMDLGEIGVIVHLHDKMTRLKTLVSKSLDNNDSPLYFESIEDTYKDLIGYSVIGLIISENLGVETSLKKISERESNS